MAIAAGAFLLSRVGASTPMILIYGVMALTGFGLGILLPILTIIMQNALPHRVLGTATAAGQFARSIGSTVGVAIFGTVLAGRLAFEIPHQLPDSVKQSLSPSALAIVEDPKVQLSPLGGKQLSDAFAPLGQAGEGLREVAHQALRYAFASALQSVFLAVAVACLICLACAFTVREQPLRRSFGEEAEQSEAPAQAVEPDSGALQGAGD
jgi:hypothetical protein